MKEKKAAVINWVFRDSVARRRGSQTQPCVPDRTQEIQARTLLQAVLCPLYHVQMPALSSVPGYEDALQIETHQDSRAG